MTLEVTRATIGHELVVGYRLRNATTATVWVVCPEPRCSYGEWPRVPFARADGNTLVLSALIAVPPSGVHYESLYLHDLLEVAPGADYEGTIVVPLPMRSNVPYPAGALSTLDSDQISTIELELGSLSCVDAAYAGQRRPAISAGAILTCARGQTVEAVQSLVRSRKRLARAP